MTPEQLVEQVAQIHAPDIPGFDDAACIECNVAYPCDTAELITSWKDTHA